MRGTRNCVHILAQLAAIIASDKCYLNAHNKAMKNAAYSTVIMRASYNIVYYLIISISKQKQISLANKPQASSITA